MIILRVENNEYKFVKPYYLMPMDEFRLIKAVVKSGVLVWNVKGKQITYNQIKEKNGQT